VTVVVAAATAESIPLALRAAWLRETHTQPHVEIIPAVDDVEIDYASDAVWAAHVAIFKNAVRDEVDAVFSSEAYGPELARRFGAVHVPVDPERACFPVSGTAVRADPVGCWRFLSPPVRAYLTRRIAVVGAESTGTTTLARALAAHYRERGRPWSATRWVPEYGRTYCEEKVARAKTDWIGDLTWDSAEFTLIAERHLALTEAAARSGSPVLICDTDALATLLWHERYVGGPAPRVEAVLDRAPADLWILTSDEGIAFEQDGWRDGEHVRSAMTGRFAAELSDRGLPHRTVTGSPEERLKAAAAAIDELLSG
jgi:NadR type nicotinamide-nucleotide adenylyltransferase